MGRAELQVRARVAGIEGDRALEEQHGAVEGLVALQAEVQHPLGEGLVGLHHVRLLAAAAARVQAQAQAGGELVHDAVLQLEDLAHAAVDLHGVDHRARVHLGDARGDAHGVAQALIAARDHPARAQLAAGARGLRLVGRAHCAQLAQGLPDPLAADDGQAIHALEVRGHRLRDAGAEPVVLRAPRDVGEAHDRHHGRRGGHLRARSLCGQRVQVAAQLAQRLVALLAVLGQHALEDPLQLGGAAGAARHRRGRVAVEDGVDDLHRVLPRERQLAGEQLVEHHAQREDVGARVEVAAQRLLR